MRALIVFLLFAGVQFAAGALALMLPAAEGDTLMAGTHITARNLGLSLLLCEGLLALCLWIWFYVRPAKFSLFFKKRKTHAASASETAGTAEASEVSAVSPMNTGEKAHAASTAKTAEATEACAVPPMNTGEKAHAASVARAVAGVLCFALSLSFLVEPLQLSDNGMEASFADMVNHVHCLLLLCVVGPTAEELVFRAGILESLRRSGLNGMWAAAISALSFAVVHGNPAQGIPAFIVGFLLGLLYLRSGNLRLCLPAHMANNVLGVCIMKCALMDKFNDLPAWGTVSVGLLLTGCSVLILRPVLRGIRKPAF